MLTFAGLPIFERCPGCNRTRDELRARRAA